MFGVFIEINSLGSTSAHWGLNVFLVIGEMGRVGCQGSSGRIPVLFGQAPLLCSPGRVSGETLSGVYTIGHLLFSAASGLGRAGG